MRATRNQAAFVRSLHHESKITAEPAVMQQENEHSRVVVHPRETTHEGVTT